MKAGTKPRCYSCRDIVSNSSFPDVNVIFIPFDPHLNGSRSPDGKKNLSLDHRVGYSPIKRTRNSNIVGSMTEQRLGKNHWENEFQSS